jgi:hypothetical protein
MIPYLNTGRAVPVRYGDNCYYKRRNEGDINFSGINIPLVSSKPNQQGRM